MILTQNKQDSNRHPSVIYCLSLGEQVFFFCYFFFPVQYGSHCLLLLSLATIGVLGFLVILLLRVGVDKGVSKINAGTSGKTGSSTFAAGSLD